jgi:hypothetical protein
VPATVFAALSVLVVVFITRELGGGRAAQGLCARSYAFAATPLLADTCLSPASLDLMVWPLVCLFVRRVAKWRPKNACYSRDEWRVTTRSVADGQPTGLVYAGAGFASLLLGQSHDGPGLVTEAGRAG